MKDQEVLDLAQAIATRLDGWTFTPGDDMCEHRAYFVKTAPGTDQQMKFAVSRDYKGKGRVTIQTWAWPKYKEYDGRNRNDPQEKTIWPRDIYPREEMSDISCAIARGPEVIAREITRRFLPEYERLYALCATKAQEYGTRAQAALDQWTAVCTSLHANPAHNVHYISTSEDNRNISLHNMNGSLKLEFYATPAQVLAVIDLMKGGTK